MKSQFLIASCVWAMIILMSIETSGQRVWQVSDANTRLHVQIERENLEAEAWTFGLDLKNIGPSVMGGRVVDVAVVGDTLYAAYATGGLWKSTNHGTTFEPLLDQTCTLGAVDAHPGGRVVVGSGEVNSSRSSYSGDGVYISDDHGRSWRHAGLEGTHHIGRIHVDAQNPDRIWVAAQGELYSNNSGGGVYRSEDGGDSWTRVLSISGKNKNSVIGVVDLVVDDSDSDHLFAASWDRTRRAHDFTESGEGSGIWESTDGGNSWERISEDTSFPEGPHAGRIGLAYHASSGTLYALLDNQADRTEDMEGTVESPSLKPEDFRDMSADELGMLSNEDLQQFLDEHGFDKADSAETIKTRVQSGEFSPKVMYDYLTDGNRALFETQIIGAQLYRYEVPGRASISQKARAKGAREALTSLAEGSSAQSGEAGVWQLTHEGWLDNVCYTYGYYFGTVCVDPNDVNTVYIAGVPLLKSTDGGQNFKSIGAPNVHVDHHRIWVDPKQPDHLVNGNDGGVNVSWDGGESWIKCNSPSVGQFYAVNVDNASPYQVYGGLQDNGTWVGSNLHEESSSWHQTGHHGYTSLGGGDGMQIQIDARNNNIVYTGSQFGWYRRTNRENGEVLNIHPRHKLGETPLRWNWQTPILLSRHQQDVLYMASNRVHRSLNGGQTFMPISPDLTRGGKQGDVPFGTITTLAEHPKHFGQLIAGSDDGLVHTSFDGGYSWNSIQLPVATKLGKGEAVRHLWVSEVAWSHHNAEMMVVALNGYRHDCLDAFVFASSDGGKSWQDWGSKLPHEPVNALIEFEDRPGWWVVGTDGGAYLTVDEGKSFNTLHGDLPRVPVHDLVIQERENHLVLGTHGRGIYRLDVDPLLSGEERDDPWLIQELAFEKKDHTAVRQEKWELKSWDWSARDIPTVEMGVWSPKSGPAQLDLRFVPTAPESPDSASSTGGGASAILDQLQQVKHQVIRCGVVNLERGHQFLHVPVVHEGAYLDAGKFTVVLYTESEPGKPRLEATTTLTIEPADN